MNGTLTKVDELRNQITEWRRQQDMLEDMIEATYVRIDEIEEQEVCVV